MALNIKDPETLRLADEVSTLAGENKTRAVRTALQERKRRLQRGGGTAAGRRAALTDLLEGEIWPQIPADELGRALSRDEHEAILGYGPEGV
jgi:antitoxin VapB